MSDNKSKALHYFIREAMVGELNYIIEDISSIMGSKDFLQDPEVISALKTYYESHLSHHRLSSGESVVVTEKSMQEKPAQVESEDNGEGEDNKEPENPSEFTYYDQARNISFSLDVTTGEVKLLEGGEKQSDEAVEGFKTSLVESLDKYIAENYKENTTLGTVSVEGSDQIEASIDISCHNLNHSNFWGGEWLSSWVVKHTLGSSEFEISGSIKISNHYFEQGNVQFNVNKSFENESVAIAGDT